MEPSAATHDQDTNYGRAGLQQRVGELWSYQAGLRLRHLHQLVGRNLRGHGRHPAPVPTCPLPSKGPRPKATMGYYFSLHTPSSKEEIYCSELQSTSNPNWVDIEPENIKPINRQSLRGVLVQLWFRPEGEAAQLVTSWGVHFSGLIPVGEALPYDHDKFRPNTLVFKLRHVFYTAPACYQDHRKQPLPPLLRYGFSLPLSETKPSYPVSALSRLHSTKRAQRQQEMRCQETQEMLEMRQVTRTAHSHVMGGKVEDCRMRVALLRDQLEDEIDRLRGLKLSADNLDNQNQDKGLELLEGYQALHRQLVQVRSLAAQEMAKRDALRKVADCLNTWRKKLIAQLPVIYPITQDSKGNYRICGVHLPDAEKYDGTSEKTLSVALGYVVHVVVLLSQLLSLPLRYPLRPYGSTATIKDTTSLLLADTAREFPLYTGGKEREKLQFNYGVFLLNKNIAQMRWYCGISTPDLRPTLANLHYLLARLSQPRVEGMQSCSRPLALHALPGSATHSVSPCGVDSLGTHLPTTMPDVMMPVSAAGAPITLEVRTPPSLLQHHHHAPRLPLNPLGAPRSALQDGAHDAPHEEEEEDAPSSWHPAKSESETTSSEVSPVKALQLCVREAAPLSPATATDKFIFVDQVAVGLGPVVQRELSLEERLAHTNGLSLSLDGLNHIEQDPYYRIKELSSCEDLNMLSNVSKVLNYSRGSEPSLLAKADAPAEEEVLPVFKEPTAELLRSWHEDDPSHYTGALEGGAPYRLEEVGEECDETFMCSSRVMSREDTKDSDCPTPGDTKEHVGSEQTSEGTPDSTETLDPAKPTEEGRTRGSPEVPRGEKDTVLSLSEFGITEDMFLNDVAFRTAALASQNCSFKMSFSRQSTEDEYH
ncbi:UV radiation resistance associated protein [Chionoecetes opilio]|uniref:UV radiation resistance associated protein n=1 Tax=Chionoecetes opilio TaxID=41210 RepID=A0A8J5CZC2_CHIOP|nr:UV radiation resistance associated protein [Chionoecetes opilio]